MLGKLIVLIILVSVLYHLYVRASKTCSGSQSLLCRGFNKAQAGGDRLDSGILSKTISFLTFGIL